jgi:hypothetical protein
MDAVDNPYSPGAGLRPAVLAGRHNEIAAFDALLRRGEVGRSVRGLILTGLRGVGKTVLLNELADMAENRKWIVARLEVRPNGAQPFLATLALAMMTGLRKERGRKAGEVLSQALRSIKAFSLTVDPDGNLGLSMDVDAVSSGDLEVDFSALAVDVGRAALEIGVGVAVFIDEFQELDKTAMASLAAGAHVAGQRGVPFTIIGAGLPNLPARLSDAKSYSERLFDYRPLDKLDPPTAKQALTEPAAAGGVRWEDAAVSTVIHAAGGYPYFLQEFGAATWDVAAGPNITSHDADNGVRLGQAVLDGGFFPSRWNRATSAQRTYLRAMAVDGESPSRTPDVATRLGRTLSNLGPIRAALIGKGLVFAPEHGVVAFTVPGMAAFIRRQPDEV